MVFSNLVFLCVFLPLTILLYYLSPNKLKNIFLLLASLIFYSWGEPQYIFLMLFSIVINYYFGLAVQKYRENKSIKSLIIFLTIFVNILILGYYKYANFLVDNINNILGTSIELAQLSLPIGISFYTFQAISYVIDVSRKEVDAQRNIIDLALFIALFPQLVAGPIVRYISIEAQLKKRTHSWSLFYEGIVEFTIGLAKKMIIANQLAVLADDIFAQNPDSINGSIAWIGIIAYSLQIYFDFSGYSNMAIGLGKMFGFTLPQNFDYPYISKSISEFWRRWHITLGAWFRSYIYIPLGGNRVSPIKLYRNLFIVWFLTGLWHGASWNFIVWGLFYGVLISIERAGFGKTLNKLPNFVQHTYVILAFMIGWVFFRSENLMYALDYLLALVSLNSVNFWDTDLLFYIKQYWTVLILGIIASTPLFKILTSKTGETFKSLAVPLFCFILLVYCIASLTTSSYNPFIYFRF